MCERFAADWELKLLLCLYKYGRALILAMQIVSMTLVVKCMNSVGNVFLVGKFGNGRGSW